MIFMIFKMAAAAILDFQKLIWRFNGFCKIAAVRHLGFVGHVLGPPTMTTWWSLSLCKILLKLEIDTVVSII